MTDTNNKIRALFLTALMVFSVFAGTVALTGTAAAANQSFTATNYHGELVWHGQTATVTGLNAGESVQLRRVTGDGTSALAKQYTATDGTITIDTANREPGTYFLRGAGADDTQRFEIAEQTLDASVDPTTVDDQGTGALTEFTLETNRGSSTTYVASSDNLDDGELEAIFSNFNATQVDTDGDGDNDGVEFTASDGTTGNLNFTDVAGGNYTIDVNARDSTASDSFNVNVNEIGSGEASFETANVEVPQGGIAEINVSLSGAASGGQGTLVIGDENADGYQANVSFNDVDDDGQVTILFNTYAAGSSGNGTVVDAAGDDTASLKSGNEQTDVTGILASGEYSLTVSSSISTETTLEEPQDLGTLFLAERSTDSMQTLTAPGGVDFDANDDNSVTESDLNSLIEDGLLTEDDTIANGDYVIHQISATGLEGVINAEGNLSAALDNGSITLEIKQTNPVQNRDPKVLNLAGTPDSALEIVKGDGSYYIAVKTSSADFERNGNDVSLADGDEFKATFTVADDRLLDSTSDEDHQSVNTTYAIENPETELDNDPVQVTASSGQTISGTSNLAPGTELTIRVRSTGDTQPRFFNSQTVTVQADGTFAGEFDFSDQAAGDTFSVSVRKGTEVASADGEVIQDSTETPTDNGTTTTDNGTPTDSTPTDSTPTDSTPTDSTPTEQTTTTTTTPGFTAVLALVALIGAALLATRRD